MSERKFFVITLKACGPCEGGGRVEHPAWKALFKQHLVPSLTDMEKYFGTRERKEWPERWLTCINCHGTGEAQEQVELSEALAEMGLIETREVQRA